MLLLSSDATLVFTCCSCLPLLLLSSLATLVIPCCSCPLMLLLSSVDTLVHTCYSGILPLSCNLPLLWHKSAVWRKSVNDHMRRQRHRSFPTRPGPHPSHAGINERCAGTPPHFDERVYIITSTCHGMQAFWQSGVALIIVCKFCSG